MPRDPTDGTRFQEETVKAEGSGPQSPSPTIPSPSGRFAFPVTNDNQKDDH